VRLPVRVYFCPAALLFLANNALAASASAQESQLSKGDITLSRFALNVEYLEAEWYQRAVTGRGLAAQDTSGFGVAGPVLVGTEDPIQFRNPIIKAIAEQLASDELAHLRVLRALAASVGLTPPARPTIDLINSFELLADAAGLNRRFNPFESESDFLLAALFFELIGLPGLVGAVVALENHSFRSTAASLLGVEGAHNGIVRTGIAVKDLFEEGNKITALAQRLANSARTIFIPVSVDHRVILSPIGDQEHTLAEPAALQQLLNGLCLSINAKVGGFFPNGLNFG
jgi:ferritin-like protein